MAADGEGAAHKGVKKAVKRAERRGNGRVKKELEQFWELVIGISKRQADCF